MKVYADQRPRRLRQICADVFLVLWACYWAWQGVSLHLSLADLKDPTTKTTSAAESLADHLGEAGTTLGEIPLIGEASATPFLRAAESARKLAEGSTASTEALEELSWKLGFGVGLGPTALLAGFYLPLRVRFARRATAGRAYLTVSANPDPWALRALHEQPLDRLLAISPDPVGAWRNADSATVHRLAALQVVHDGLTPPWPDPSPPTTPQSTPAGGEPPPASS